MRIRHLMIAAFAGWAALAAATAQAQRDVYTVAGIEVSGTGQTTGEARDRALQEGRQQALRILASELAPGAQASIAPLTPAEARSLIAEESLANERTTNNSYQAVMTVRFIGSAARQYFGAGGTPSATASTAPAPFTSAPVAPAAPAGIGAAAGTAPLPLAPPASDAAGGYRAFVPISNIHDWNDVLTRLRQTPGVDGVTVVSLSRGAGQVRFSYSGSLTDLQQALAGAQLALSSAEGTSAPAPWRLELTNPIVPPA